MFGFETLLRRYNEKIKRNQTINHPATGRHFKPPFNTFSTDVREPCQWCLENKNKTFFHKKQDCRNKNHQSHGDKRSKGLSDCFICKVKGCWAAVCPQAANFQAVVQQQKGMANLAAHKVAHDAVVYHVMMGESAAHYSIPLNVFNGHSPAAVRPALVASIFGL